MIRKSRNSDVDALASIWLEASIEAHDFVPPGHWESLLEAMRRTYLPSAVNYVFEDDGRMAGFASVAGDRLAAVFVDPARQGRGIGGALLEHVKARYDCLNLSVYETNRRAVAFYERHGFVKVGEGLDEHTGWPEMRMRFQRKPGRRGG